MSALWTQSDDRALILPERRSERMQGGPVVPGLIDADPPTTEPTTVRDHRWLLQLAAA